MKVSFVDTVGDDIEVDIIGHYDKPDMSVGYWGSFDVECVYVKNSDVNIISLLSDKTIERLEYHGMDAAVKQQYEEKCEAAEMRRQAMRDNQLGA